MRNKKFKSNILINVIFCILLFSSVFSVLAAPVSAQYEFDDSITSQDKLQINNMMKPINKIFNLAVYIYSAIAVLVVFYIVYLISTSGGAPEKKNKAKNATASLLLGGVVFVGGPMLVRYLLS